MSEPEAQPPQDTEATQVHPWENLAAERHILLRLAAQPAAPSGGPRPTRFAELGIVERHADEQSFLGLNVRLPETRASSERNQLKVWVDHPRREVSFGPPQGLQVDPENRGLGRFMLAQAILWLQRSWPHYAIRGEHLPLKDSLSEENRLRRDHVLQAQGFVVEYSQDPLPKASYAPCSVSALRPHWHKDKVQIIDTLDSASMLEQANQKLLEQEVAMRKQDERIALLKREDNTLRFSLSCLIVFAVFQAILLIWIAIH